MNLNDSTKGLTKAQIERQKILDMLDQADSEVEANPTDIELNGNGAENFEALYNNSLDERDYKVGDVVMGKVLDIQPDNVLVDINYKSEGLVSISEFRAIEGKLNVEVGQEIEVYIDRLENESGMVVLSKDKADMLRAWEDISRAAESEELLEGTIIAKVKGGLSVDIGVKAFLPGSQIDLRPVRNMDGYIGKKYKFKVIKFNKRRGNIVLSRRAILEEERESLRSQTLDAMKEGAEVLGIVKNITDYGAFVDLGGMDGLLHITDMSWGRVKHPSEILNVGDEIKVKVLKYDSDKERVSLGLKQMQEDPWEAVKEGYPPGTKLSGEIVSLADYGAFVELGDGIEGLIHVSEMSWTKRVKNPSQIVKVGDNVRAVVLGVDVDNERFSLGIKQLEADPWANIESKYGIGTQHEVKVSKIADFGVFVELESDIEGLIHISELSTKRVDKPEEVLAVGDTVKAEIITIDRDARKIGLSVKLVKLREQNADVDDYIKKATSTSKSSIGDLFGDTLKQLSTGEEPKSDGE